MEQVLRFRFPSARFLLMVAVACCVQSWGCRKLPEIDLATEIETQVVDSSSPLSVGENWPAWRGGEAHGVADHGNLPLTWNAANGFAWRTAVPGHGNSSPVVWDGKVLLTSTVPEGSAEQFVLLCYDAVSGDLLWQRVLGTASGRTHSKNGYASSTVATDGQRVFAFFGSGGMFCCDLTGSLLWQTPLGNPDQQWGIASSPALYGNLVIQCCDAENGSFLVGLDKSTGLEVWKIHRQSLGSWSSPLLTETNVDGRLRPELIINGTGSQGGSQGNVIAYDPATGQELWRFKGTTDIPCPTAIIGLGLVVSTSGGNGPILAIRPGGAGEVTRTHLVWRHAHGAPYVPTGVIYRERLYLISDRGVASCFDVQTGDRIWSSRLGASFSASLVAGDGRIYAFGEGGEAFVIAAADEFQLLATNRLEEPCLATPALAQGWMYIRTQGHLYAIAPADPVIRVVEDDPLRPSLPGPDSVGNSSAVGVSSPLPEEDVPSPSDGPIGGPVAPAPSDAVPSAAPISPEIPPAPRAEEVEAEVY